MTGQYVCHAPGRVNALRDAAQDSPPRRLNGIHFLEVSADQRRLDVHFVFPLARVPAQPLTKANVEIRGGERVRNPGVTGVHAQGNVLTVEVASPGDFSRYVLRLVASVGIGVPPAGIDPALAQIEFSFKANCPRDLDCRQADTCQPDVGQAPPIDYLARDYPTFRRLLLDRMTALMPGWRERSPADLWVTLAEAIAFRADELSYYQDAVATEAYLGTARQRVSVRRHTRLLDYAFHDGCNARTWVAFEVGAEIDGFVLPGCEPATGLGGTLLMTGVPGIGAAISRDSARTAIDAGAQPFELLEPLTVYSAHNTIDFHTWSDDACCLPKGATGAFLRDNDAARLRLLPGDVLIFEARAGEATAEAADADPLRRHAVRLTQVDPPAITLPGGARGMPAARRDPVTGQAFVEIAWDDADALPFPLCLSKRIGGVLHTDMAGAVGNIALADHGATAPLADALTPLPGGRVPHYPLDRTAVAPLTQQGRVRVAGSDSTVLVDPAAPAAAALRVDVSDVCPALEVRSDGDRRRWRAQRDLLASDAEAADFVVETENDGHAVLRFGDGVNGRASDPDLTARVRTGSGLAGNVGAEAIRHVAVSFDGIRRVRNPLPATGGLDPQPVSQARLQAPQAFRRQERAVTADDYAAVTAREPRVQRAVATRRWTGSWYTMFITVDRRGGLAFDAQFEADLAAFIERYRMAGHDIKIDAPRFVALDIALHVCTKPGYFPADVERRLLDAFSAGIRANGEMGFFHPDRYTFGQPVYLSAVIAAAMQVPGVAYVTAVRFQRLGRNPDGEIGAGRIPMGRLEIAQLDNDPSAPENGRIRFDVETGA
ncbi:MULTISPECIES: putative baseplate assembly protein [Ralstonia solanacearum species complex]|uniref:putative baseplate assembly protein n=1 Tax=Ralstonia solanacearum species complex TaxID=3116862 RepID=UPI000E591CE6|nr:putative baseplate assembly protein [Ralstonia solanacearum]BEU72144.1 putative baseplate assembly protein [Ralstonia pseudosolanacearum]AXV77035.1 putative baseplate assembly protein [Ralstonia solanacearum]AXV91051.1 putative baseplate assembly protein [Ralstonia solanacearum]AXW19198.1 putative baseplate assembly protein [Ralstonia solanacearum]AXW75960.1 putative baseplate assembly protein [Ralstonia solanacearum]